MKQAPHAARAFTLVELLVVVGILVLVTAGSLLLLEQTDDQMRYKKNQEDYREIHTALFGPNSMTTISGNLVVSGYLADTGRLPTSLDDLVRQPVDVPNWSPIDNPVYGIKLHHGWRGPYLNTSGGSPMDAWGNPWHYAPPLTRTLPLDLGSWGRDGLPGGVEQYEEDYPENHSIDPSYFTLTAVPIPVRRVKKISEGPKLVVLGVIHAGMSLREAFEEHRTLLRYPTGQVATIVLNSPGEDKSDKKDKKDKNSGSSGTSTPSNLTYDLGYARQLQLVLYDPERKGNRLGDKLHSVDPMVITYLPRVSTIGQERSTDGSESLQWITP